MDENTIPIYLDEKGLEVSISQGIGGPRGDWLVCRKNKFGSHKRIKTIGPVPYDRKDMAIKILEAHATKKKYQLKERRERL